MPSGVTKSPKPFGAVSEQQHHGRKGAPSRSTRYSWGSSVIGQIPLPNLVGAPGMKSGPTAESRKLKILHDYEERLQYHYSVEYSDTFRYHTCLSQSPVPVAK